MEEIFSNGKISICKYLWKCLIVQRNRLKFETEWKVGEVAVVVEHIWVTFDLVVFRVVLGSFGGLVSKWPVT